MTEDQRRVTGEVVGETEICAPPSESCALSGDYLNLKGIEFCDFSASELANRYGKIVQLAGNLLEAEGISAATGDICRIIHAQSPEEVLAEVIGFGTGRTKLSPLTHLNGVRPGSLVQVHKAASDVMVSEAMLGRVLDGL